MHDEKAPHAARITAAEAVLSRGWGKPQQDVAVVPEPAGLLMSEAFARRRELYEARQRLGAAEECLVAAE